MNVAAKVTGVLATVVVAVSAGTTALAAPDGVDPAQGGTSVDILRFHEAAVFVDEGPGGYVGAVSIRAVVRGKTSVDVFLGSEESITCPDGSDDVRNETLRTQERFATEPGPVTLDVDPRLHTAHGEAVVDLVHSVVPGCGGAEVETVLPGRSVTIDVIGTSELVDARMTGSVSARDAFDRARVSSISRDGTGSMAIAGLVDSTGDAAWLKYAVEQSVRHGTPPEMPEGPAPEGGRGALGAASTTHEPADGIGVLFQDAIVAATIGPRPGREMSLSASTLTVTGVRCPGGDVGLRFRDASGTTAATVTIGNRLASAEAAGTATMSVVVFDECTGALTERMVPTRLALQLTATGPAVRVRDTFAFSAPPQPVERLNGWSLRRMAAGVVTAGTFSAPTDVGAIARASR